MPAVSILSGVSTSSTSPSSGLPLLFKTPGGLAIIEIQGTINNPQPQAESTGESRSMEDETTIGRLDFPLYSPSEHTDKEGLWMKKVHFYVGRYQRLSGEVKKLGKPLIVLGKKAAESAEGAEQLEILDIIKYRILFSSRPEPVGD